MTQPRSAKSKRSPAPAAGWTPPRDRDRDVVALVVLAALALAAYANSFQTPFVFDGVLLTTNFSAGQIWPWQSVVPPSMIMIARPVAFLTFGANYALGKDSVWGFHATNLAIHILAGWLLYGVVRRTLASPSLGTRYGQAARPLAFAAAAIWLVHPLQTECVTNLFQRFESLMGLFYLLTLYAFIRAQGSARPAIWLATSVVACALGTATKEVIATAPLVVLWYDRAFVAESWRELFQKRGKYYAALFACWLLLGWLLYRSFHVFEASGVLFVEGLTPLSYALSQGGVILHYLQLSLWPSDLCIDYHWQIARQPSQYVPQVAAMLALLAGTVWCMFRLPALGFLGGWFFLILGPTSSIAPLHDLAVEHRMYLPLAAVVVLAVMAAYEAWRMISARVSLAESSRAKLWAAVPAGLLLLVCVALGYRTHQRNLDYASELSIWQDVLRQVKDNPRALDNRGSEYIRADRLDEALADLDLAIQLQANFPEAYSNRAQIYQRRSQWAASLPDLNKSIELEPHSPRTRVQRAETYERLGRYAEALADYDEALRIDVNSSLVLNSRAWLLATCPDAKVRDGRRAVDDATRACELTKWRAIEAWDTLAAAYAENGDYANAIKWEAKAVDRMPKDTPQLSEFQHRLQLYRSGKPFRDELKSAGS